MPPREWRKKPGHIQIGEPVAVHFVPPASIRLPSRDTVRGPDLVEKMVEHHVWLTGEMVRLAERLTPEQLDEPVLVEVDDDEQTLRSLLSRLVGQMGMWNAAMATRDYDWSVEDHESVALDAAAARDRGSRATSRTCGRSATRGGSTTPSSTRCASRPRCSPTAA